MNKIKSLEKIGVDIWECKYLGNSGEYELKIFMDENYGKSSCNCCSYFYPCRHIREAKKVILRRQKVRKLFGLFNKINSVCRSKWELYFS
ncbi:MAG: hypothetical protein LBT04_06625 [Prevotellaceae bacterium]|jgi:hypothetical protein|nr:hypothetical protein [Prevotellaceae bacterium]